MLKVSENILKKYAQVAIEIGLNLQPGQILIINADAQSDYFVKYAVEHAYKCKARKVIVRFNSQPLQRINALNAELEVLKEVPQFVQDEVQAIMDQAAIQLHIISDIPDILEGVDPQKIQEIHQSRMKLDVYQRYMSWAMNSTTQWNIIALPNEKWAKKVFPNSEDALSDLWKAILYTCRITEDNDPIVEWNKHNQILSKHTDILNNYNFKSLIFRNSLGTDIEVGLVENHIWKGGATPGLNKIKFNANIPTEECFTMPDRFNVNGKVVATKPLNEHGVLIKDFWLEFKDGKVINFDAKENRETLKNILESDEHSNEIGEIALVSYDSPISNMDVLFYNTLFDENASCHMALGAAYPDTIVDGDTMDKETLLAHGANVSSVHVDFMFGSSDLSVIGKTHDGQEVKVFENGNFVI